MSEFIISYDQLHVGSILGEGGNAIVSHADYNGKEVAVKVEYLKNFKQRNVPSQSFDLL